MGFLLASLGLLNLFLAILAFGKVRKGAGAQGAGAACSGLMHALLATACWARKRGLGGHLCLFAPRRQAYLRR